MEYLITAYQVISSIVFIASIITNWTDNPRDDVWSAKAYKVLEKFAFLNNKAKQL
jgi:hypothetical protein